MDVCFCWENKFRACDVKYKATCIMEMFMYSSRVSMKTRVPAALVSKNAGVGEWDPLFGGILYLEWRGVRISSRRIDLESPFFILIVSFDKRVLANISI